MAEYRAYTLGSDDHIITATPLVCSDDTEAIEQAIHMIDGHDIEIWSGERFVIRLDSNAAKSK